MVKDAVTQLDFGPGHVKELEFQKKKLARREAIACIDNMLLPEEMTDAVRERAAALLGTLRKDESARRRATQRK